MYIFSNLFLFLFEIYHSIEMHWNVLQYLKIKVIIVPLSQTQLDKQVAFSLRSNVATA